MTAPAPKAPHFAEFVALIASVMALGALGIDSMLPALPVIGHDLHVPLANQTQWIISIYFIGLGVGQLVFGILSDSLGRKSVLLGGIAAYVVFALIAAASHGFVMLLTVRCLQGFFVASTSVVTRSIIRDLYSGPRMAKVMSISVVIFLIVPILAPSFGAAVLLVLPWRFILLFMALFGVLSGTWAWLRLPETLPPERRHRPDFGHLRRVAFFVATEPSSVFYTLSVAFLFGSLLAYVQLMPQIFQDVFHKPSVMPLVFAGCATTMGGASIINASLVERLGWKRISHATLLAFLVVSGIHLAWSYTGHETILSFLVLQALTMGLMSLSTSNFNAIAMEKVGHVAGSAASLQGVVSTVGAGLVAATIGQGWSGGVWLVPLGAFICGIIALGLVAISEKGRLFSVL